MSHKSGHVIIKALLESPDITPEQVAALEIIQARDQYTRQERWAIAWMVYKLLG